MAELISDAARADFDDWAADAHSPGWTAWRELKCVDRDESAVSTDRRIHEYEAVDGTWVFSKAAWSVRFAEAAELPADPATRADDRYGRTDWPEGAEWQDGDRLYRLGQ
ncbi:hypothetical protein ABT025_00880 [Streptomyces sp. NPDC002809]|uniref:hypothetical protein n=1 Tax=Streptomyces sp. NPDC002809 TaxID=3154433 RepID=UPI00332011CD